jgi:pilus assembly protein Flp/PilA
MKMKNQLRHLVRDQRGATAIEYGLIVSLIVIALLAGLSSLGGGTDAMWGKVQNRVISAS